MSTPVRPAPVPFHVFDTTLRDGSQQEGLNLSVNDKLAIAALLDELGVDFIEGGWPGANPSDTSFFPAMASGAVTLKNADPGRVRLHPPGGMQGRRRPAHRGPAGLPAPTSPASWPSPTTGMSSRPCAPRCGRTWP